MSDSQSQRPGRPSCLPASTDFLSKFLTNTPHASPLLHLSLRKALDKNFISSSASFYSSSLVFFLLFGGHRITQSGIMSTLTQPANLLLLKPCGQEN
ncbi:uncharacterized protein BO97DRAFT_7087 [Aspergillus homomorphus CBS 101889]|uniref:Uncharacterized protein n=1 Tax=Aspergillus homomorphus (strain CBS 101889) TaxID=1450537 RepID=A0A395IBW2_ASPHC|nr:hypothetical protein BO97DRAFT_7087 [Aspergillus homomorphus CBS 101889]RAL17485.1 hypothetical protein BO97DRAFT_7087 [Aspergillus homomorphus CBS 101889]